MQAGLCLVPSLDLASPRARSECLSREVMFDRDWQRAAAQCQALLAREDHVRPGKEHVYQSR